MNAGKTCMAAFVCLIVATAAQSQNHQQPSYQLTTRIEPSNHYIQCTVIIKHPPASRFYLNGNFTISHTAADGRDVPHRRDASSKPPPWVIGTAVVVVDTTVPDELLIEYTGTLPDVVSGVNMITPDLVELAVYAAWYPVFEGNALFDFSLTADLPSGYVTTGNGVLERQNESGGRAVTFWRSIRPGSDIVLVSSPGLKKWTKTGNAIQVESFFKDMPENIVEAKGDRLLDGFQKLSGVYGAPSVKGLLRFVYSPRGGWGYSRVPAFVVPEAYAVSQLEEEFGQARAFHGEAHEMAHFWWSIVDTATPDDWINEGLAEFSAYRLSESYYGDTFAGELVKAYRDHASRSATDTPIALTTADSPDRYVNRYEKTALLYIEARRRFGEERLDRFLRALYARFAGTRDATTALFLEEAEKQMGPEAKNFFSEAVYRAKWIDEGRK